MSQSVVIEGRDQTGRVVRYGTLTLARDRVVADPPDHPKLRWVLGHALPAGHGKMIQPSETEAWFKRLPIGLTGSLIWARKGQDLAEAWDEADHPRHPAGSEEGGRFADGGGASVASATIPASIARDMPQAVFLTQQQWENARESYRPPAKTAMPVGHDIPTPQLDPIRGAEDRYWNAKIEHGILTTPEGKVLIEKDGNDREIDLTSEEIARVTNKGGVFSHNHPNGSAFSVEDVRFAGHLNLTEIRASGADRLGRRWLYRLRPDHGWPSDLALVQQYVEVDQAVYHALRPHVEKGTLLKETANFEHFNEVWKRVAAHFGFFYERTQVAGLPYSPPGLPKINA